jgi:hypothetical protein
MVPSIVFGSEAVNLWYEQSIVHLVIFWGYLTKAWSKMTRLSDIAEEFSNAFLIA